MSGKSTHHINKKWASSLDRRTLLQRSLVGGGALMAGSLLGSRFISAAFASDSAPMVETNVGKIRGAAIDGVQTFKGVPYGASTSGTNRFLPPTAPKPSTDLHDAIECSLPSTQRG
jgi:para-nitrobenzyl esterase